MSICDRGHRLRLHFEPAYKHARHYIGWTARDDVIARLNVHLQGRGSPLIRAAVAAGVDVQLAATYQGTRYLERRLKRWHKTGSSARSAANIAAAAPIISTPGV
jgi:predicted GIY-YIG superfamily endonuclease